MNSFNKTPNAPHKITAFLISMIGALGIHHKFFEDEKISISSFLAVFTIATIQLMAIACVPMRHAIPKQHPTDIFKNFIMQNNNYEKIDNEHNEHNNLDV